MNFEAGNAASARAVDENTIELRLRGDNDDALPRTWRNWFYAKLENVPVDVPVDLKIVGGGFECLYLPVFSYEPRPDKRNTDAAWRQFRESEVTQDGRNVVTVRAVFTQPTVWVARWHPYTYSRLVGFLGGLRGKPGVTLGTLGDSPRGRDTPSVTVTDGASPRAKRRIVIHARTHPGEVGSSFLLEGLLRFASGSGPEARKLRAKAVLDVVPMLNVDGVIAGNNRVTTYGVNLEGKWLPASTAAGEAALDPDKTPPEVQLMHSWLLERLDDGALPAVALNLHASAGQPDDSLFFFPHFGPAARGYAAGESSLYRKQIAFIDSWRSTQGAPWFNPPATDGQSNFVSRALPESWWWRTYGDDVMAITVESTYGRAAKTSRWMTPEDMRTMGFNLGRALVRYLDGLGPTPRGGLQASAFSGGYK